MHRSSPRRDYHIYEILWMIALHLHFPNFLDFKSRTFNKNAIRSGVFFRAFIHLIKKQVFPFKLKTLLKPYRRSLWFPNKDSRDSHIDIKTHPRPKSWKSWIKARFFRFLRKAHNFRFLPLKSTVFLNFPSKSLLISKGKYLKRSWISIPSKGSSNIPLILSLTTIS